METKKTLIKRFEVGGTYKCAGLYGGMHIMRVVGRTDTTISFVYDGKTSDDTSVHEAKIALQTFTVYGEGSEELGVMETESVVAWTYCSPYARDKGDVDHGYYFAFNKYCKKSPSSTP